MAPPQLPPPPLTVHLGKLVHALIGSRGGTRNEGENQWNSYET